MSTKFTEMVVVDAAGGSVVFDGVDFTLNAYVEVRNASSLTIRNCRFYKMNLPAAKNYLVKVIGDIPCKLVVEKCFFGNNPANGNNKMHNLLEMNAKLATASSFSDNYFTAGSCTHNHINIYGAKDSASIFVDGNTFEVNDMSIRIGVKGEPPCTIYCRNNKVLAYSADNELYRGVLLVQPYGTQTKSFKNMKIVMEKNTLPGDELGVCIYNGANDLQITDANKPVIMIDGVDRTADVPVQS